MTAKQTKTACVRATITRNEVLKRDKFTCAFCRESMLQVEVRNFHVEKHINWQTATANDLWCLCSDCFVRLCGYCLERWKQEESNDSCAKNARAGTKDS